MPTPASNGQDALEDAHGMYRRVLTSWVLDVARLRRTGLHRPGRRKGSGSIMYSEPMRDVVAYRYPQDSTADISIWRRRAA